jgi:hypothetical protein
VLRFIVVVVTNRLLFFCVSLEKLLIITQAGKSSEQRRLDLLQSLEESAYFYPRDGGVWVAAENDRGDEGWPALTVCAVAGWSLANDGFNFQQNRPVGCWVMAVGVSGEYFYTCDSGIWVAAENDRGDEG